MFEEKIMENNQRAIEEKSNAIAKDRRVYTTEEIQKILGVSKTTIYNLIKEKQFSTVRVGRSYRISKQSFDKWLESQGCE